MRVEMKDSKFLLFNICDNFFKIKAFLRNIRSQINILFIYFSVKGFLFYASVKDFLLYVFVKGFLFLFFCFMEILRKC